MPLGVPGPVIAGLSKIAGLPDDSFQELLSALGSIPPRILQDRIFDDSGLFELKSIPIEDLTTIRDAVFSLYVGRVNTGVPVSTFVNQVIESQSASALLDIDSEQLKQRVSQLLTIKSLEAIAKAHDLFTEHSHLFTSSRLVSQVRPIFGEKVDQPPTAAVIEHMLTIAYSQAGRRNEFVIGLDAVDIQQLMETLKRAQAEAESLKAFLQAANMTHIEIA